MLKKMQDQSAQILEGGAAAAAETEAAAAAVNEASVYVGNVAEEVTPEDLAKHFQSCGAINRVTILVDKYTGRSKG